MSRLTHDRRPLVDSGLITGRRLLTVAAAIAALWLAAQLKSVLVVSVVALVLVLEIANEVLHARPPVGAGVVAIERANASEYRNFK